MNNDQAAKIPTKTAIRYQIQNAAELLSDLHCDPDMPLSVSWSISPRNIHLATGLVGHVRHENNDRDRTLADLQDMARILGSTVVLGTAEQQLKDKEFYQIEASIKNIPVQVWAFVRREPAVTAPVRAVG